VAPQRLVMRATAYPSWATTAPTPMTMPVGTQPADSTVAVSWPDRSHTNGRARRETDLARTAVPTTLNSSARRVLPGASGPRP